MNWELDYLEKADLVLFYFQANTLSPISLLEFGLVSEKHKIKPENQPIVICSEEFWRYGNVKITAVRELK